MRKTLIDRNLLLSPGTNMPLTVREVIVRFLISNVKISSSLFMDTILFSPRNPVPVTGSSTISSQVSVNIASEGEGSRVCKCPRLSTF